MKSAYLQNLFNTPIIIYINYLLIKNLVYPKKLFILLNNLNKIKKIFNLNNLYIYYSSIKFYL
jgi:hypothetical protein